MSEWGGAAYRDRDGWYSVPAVTVRPNVAADLDGFTLFFSNVNRLMCDECVDVVHESAGQVNLADLARAALNHDCDRRTYGHDRGDEPPA